MTGNIRDQYSQTPVFRQEIIKITCNGTGRNITADRGKPSDRKAFLRQQSGLNAAGNLHLFAERKQSFLIALGAAGRNVTQANKKKDKPDELQVWISVDLVSVHQICIKREDHKDNEAKPEDRLIAARRTQRNK